MAIEARSFYKYLSYPAYEEPQIAVPAEKPMRSEFKIKPVKPHQIKLIENGIDIQRNDKLHGNTDYEDRCFSSIVSGDSDSVILGPQLIDKVFPYGFMWMRRPDAIELDVSSPTDWVITQLYEFKINGEDRQIGRKVNGFAELTAKMRDEESLLPRLLHRALPHVLPIPNRFVTPPDSNIDVTFVSPNGSAIIFWDTDFRLNNLNVAA